MFDSGKHNVDSDQNKSRMLTKYVRREALKLKSNAMSENIDIELIGRTY